MAYPYKNSQNDETLIKSELKQAQYRPVYFFFGNDPYLKRYYSEQIVDKVVAKGLEAFNLARFNWKESKIDDIVSAAETLPVFAPQKCVVIVDFDIESAKADDTKQLELLLQNPPAGCILVFRQNTVEVNAKKSAKWKSFIQKINQSGLSICLDHRDNAALARLLVSGSAKRGCTLTPELARYVIDTCGNDMQVLLGELEKICFFAQGEITRQHIDAVTIPTLDTSVFDLSKALLRSEYGKAMRLLDELFARREDPVAIFSILCMAYVDLYRAKVASLSENPVSVITDHFNYRGKAFRMQNAARDSAGIPVERLRQSLELLGKADRMLKSSRTDNRIVLEQTITELISLQ